MSAKFEDIKGLTDAQVISQREKHGANELPPPEVEGFFDKLKDNFDEPLIKILLAALVITLVLAFFGHADYLEGIGIAVAVFLATFVATYSEYKNENSFRLLQEQASKVNNKVFRNGLATQVPVTDIVVGDLVLLQAGDKIPADGTLISGELMVDQVALTGEKLSVRKMIAPDDFEWKGTDLYDERECFKGTVVDDGEAVLTVSHVGEKTYFGSVYLENLKNKEEERESPLQVKLSNLADGIAKFGYIGAASITVSFLFKQFVIDNGYNWEAITNYLSIDNIATPLHDVVTSIILAVIVIVVAVPEGLPMMIAIVLSLNMRKLLSTNVLVRKLLGIETAGSIDILFVDKTGTLTKGIFQPQNFVLGDGKQFKKFAEIPQTFATILGFCARESTSAVAKGKDGGLIGGNASDRALLEFLDKAHLEGKTDTKIEHEILFNSERKFSAVQISWGSKAPIPLPVKGKLLTIVKGAPDLLFPYVKTFYNVNGEEEKFSAFELNEVLNQLSNKGTRVIAIATTPTPIKDAELIPAHSKADVHSIAVKPTIPGPLTLVGILGIKDEIRAESRPALDLAKKAGIQVVMITGDRKETAVSVAAELGLTTPGDTQGIITSDQLANYSDEELEEKIPELAVIARALPTDKSRLVRICKNANRVVGMTGDGVNDSAALVAADVGFAMGSGSEVAKEASDIVILDDNFESITKAVLYGRTIFKSIRKFIVFQSTVNAASLLIVFLGPFCGFDFPLTLIQLLWVNIVMDTFAAIAFGGEPAIDRYMYEKPIKRDEHIITPTMWCSIIFNGVFIAGLCVFALLYPPIRNLFIRDGKPDEHVFLTAFFCLFIFITNFNSFNARSPRKLNIFDHITQNRGFLAVSVVIWIVQITFTEMGGKFLRTVGMTTYEWVLVICVASLIFPFDAIRKLIMIQVCKSLQRQNQKQSQKNK